MRIAYTDEEGTLIVTIDDNHVPQGCPFGGMIDAPSTIEAIDGPDGEPEDTKVDGGITPFPCGIWCPHCDVVLLAETGMAGQVIGGPDGDPWNDNKAVVQLTCGGCEKLYLFGPDVGEAE